MGISNSDAQFIEAARQEVVALRAQLKDNAKETGVLSRRMYWLTVALIAIGVFQLVATVVFATRP